MQKPPAERESRRPTSPLTRLIGAGIVVAGVLIAALVIGPRLRPEPASPTPDVRPTTVAATVPVAGGGPTASTGTPVAPAPTLTTIPPATTLPSPTAIPPTPTAAPPNATPVPSGTPNPDRYLGRDPLPPGVDLSNGPFLKDLKARGYPGVNVGDGGLGDELKSAYLEALKVGREALNNADASQLRQYFIGEALEDMTARISRRQTDTSRYVSIATYEPRVMEFIPQTAVPGKYEVVDARTETISTAERLPDGKPGNVVKSGEAERACYSVQMVKEGGRWKIEFEEAHHDGPKGNKCPPGWS